MIDVDHIFDSVVFKRRRDLRPSAFLKYYLEGQVRRAVLPLHSYELLAARIVLAWLTNREWLWGYVRWRRPLELNEAGGAAHQGP